MIAPTASASALASLPIIDIAPLVTGGVGRHAAASAIGRACRDRGFFYIVGHGVDVALQQALEAQCRRFFALPIERQLDLHMSRGGRAWRGYFPVGAALTSGQPDHQEGIYFGSELDDHHPQVLARLPLHGRNLFPADLPELRPTAIAYGVRRQGGGFAGGAFFYCESGVQAAQAVRADFGNTGSSAQLADSAPPKLSGSPFSIWCGP
jgi:isopenicillin N synthase-like dioxygenase